MKHENLLSYFIEHSPAALAMFDADMRCIIASRRWMNDFRFGDGNIIGKTYYELFPGSETEWKEIHERCLKGAIEIKEEVLFTLNDGSKEWTRWEIRPIKHSEEAPRGIMIFAEVITEWIQARERLLASQETTRHIMNSALDAIIGMDKKGIITLWSPQAERIFGWKHEEVLQQKMSEVIVPERYREQHEKGLARYLKTGTSSILNKPIELSALHRSGSEFSIELSVVPVTEGEDDFFCAFIRDITERKKATELFKYQFDNSPDIIVIINPDHRIESINKGRPDGPTAQELIGQDCIAVLPEESRQISLENLNRCFETGENQECENMLEGDRWVKSRFVPIRIDGRIKHTMVIATDITEKKRAVEKLKQSEERHRALVENISDTIILLNEKGDILYKNPGYTRTSGFSFDDLKTKTVFDLLHPLDQEKANNVFTFVVENPGTPVQTQFRVLHKEGHYFWAEGSILNLLHNESVNGIIINYRDITERIRFEEQQQLMEFEREKTMTELLQRNRDLEQFSHIVSHNLRGPVATMIGLSDLLNQIQLTQAEKEQVVNGMGESAQKLDMVIKDLNTILQVKRDVNERKELIRLSDLINDIKVSLHSLIHTEKVQFVYNFNSINEITTIKSYLYSICYNLISNSIKYRQPNIDPLIEISAKKAGTKTILHFKDNGLGIDLYKKGRDIFGLYERFHFHTEGKGMGLFIVKSQVEALGGKISVQSKVNHGTVFTIEFDN